MTSAPTKPLTGGSLKGLEKLQLETPFYKPRGTSRLDGPALPPPKAHTSDVETLGTLPGLESLNERLERLAFGRRPEGHDSPPLETYTTTATAHGDVVRATPEYVRWFHRAYPAAGPEDRARIPTPSPVDQGMGGTSNQAQGRWAQNAIAP